MKRRMSRWLVLAAITATLTPLLSALPIDFTPARQAMASAGTGESVGVTYQRGLVTWWSQSRTDNYASGTYEGDASAMNAGYRNVRSEGLIQSNYEPGMLQVISYWNPTRQDNFTTCSDAGIRYAGENGYYLVRIEGYAWPTLAGGFVPLQSYWHAGMQDLFVTATTAGRADAMAAGYSFVRTECYILVN